MGLRWLMGVRGWLVMSLAVLAIALTGCNPSQFKTSAARIPQLVFSAPSDPTTFNYPLNSSRFSVFGLIYEGMIGENGETGELEPILAESWEVSPDKKKITFKLRDGLKWSDGAPLTAEDVVFSFRDVYLNEKVPTGLRDILQIGETGQFPAVRKLDNLRVEFSVPEPFAPFLRFSGGIPILPAHILRNSIETTDSKGDLKFLSMWGTDTDPKQIVVNGGYTLDTYIPSQRVIYTRNPYYWRKDLQGQPQPYIERIVQQIISSDDAEVISFRSGELDSLSVNPESFQLMKREEQRGKFKIYNGGPENGSRFVGFNLNKAKNAKGQPFVDPIKSRWFNTLAFRQAIAHALDRERMRTFIYQGLGELQNSPLDSANPFYRSPEQGIKTYDYDPALAKKILLEAGFKYTPTGQLQDWDGHPVKFTLLVKAEEKTRVSAATQIQQDLAQIGITTDLQILSFNLIQQKLKSRNWECYVGAFGGGASDPHSGYNIWASKGSLHQFNQGQQPGEDPITDWETSSWERDIDRLFTEGVKELDESKRKEIYGRFQQIVQEQLPFVFLVNPLSLEAVRDRIENVKFTANGGAFWNLYELKMTEE